MVADPLHEPCFPHRLDIRSRRLAQEKRQASRRGHVPATPEADGVPAPRIQRTWRRKGVTLLKGLALSEADLTALAKIIKQACSSGGTVKDGVIEIQGEQREKIAEVLRKLGYKVKVAGNI